MRLPRALCTAGPLVLGTLALLGATSPASPASPAAGDRAPAAAAASTVTCAPTGAGGAAVAGGGRTDVFDSLAQLLPSQPQIGASTASICQARNGFESFQVEVTAGATALSINSVAAASALTGPGGTTLPAADLVLSREDYTTLGTMTDGELSNVIPRDPHTGACPPTTDCRFPDALIPDIDPLFQERRHAFPFTVPAHQDRVVWVDAFVPAGQAPGLYSGMLTVTPSAGAATAVPVSLQVVNATIPSTSSVHSAFFIVQGGGRGFTGATITDAQYAEYAELGLEDRINIVPDSPLAVGSGGLATYLQPLLTGTDPRVQRLLHNAQLTDFPVQAPWTSAQFTGYKTLFAQLGITPRLSVYCDEGTPQGCGNLVAGSGAQAASPGVPVLATAAAQDGWPDPDSTVVPPTTGPVNLAQQARGVIPIVQDLDPISGFNPYQTLGSRMPAFGHWRATQTGRQVWIYGSCMSGGCGGQYSGSTLYSGWPSYGIDQVASEQRAMGWQLFGYGLDGEEYWSVDNDTSIWTDPSPAGAGNSGMNGDGTLFYPWDAARIGGADPIPIESIRLKRIRDGREDYELLKLAAAQSPAAAAAVMNIVHGAFPSIDQSAPSAAGFDGARQQLIAMFSSPPAAPTAVVGRTANAGASVTWRAPASTGGSAVTGYVVTASPGDATCSTTGALACVVGGLTNGTPYTFTVLARSAAGSSPPSVASNPVVPVALDSIDDLNCDGTADFLAVKSATGQLLFYPRLKTGSTIDWAPNVPIVGAGGYGGSSTTLTYRSLLLAGDVNGDAAPDVLGVTPAGAVVLLPGNCTGQVGAAVATSASVTTPIGVGDFSGDGHPDVLDRHADGTLWMLASTGTGGFAAPTQVGAGWGGFDTLVAAGDLNHDGHPDVIGRRSDGSLLLYEGNGASGWTPATVNGGIVLAPTLPKTQYPVLVGAGDFDGDGGVDLAAVNTSGQLLSFKGAVARLAATGQVIGNGWQPAGILVEIAS